MGSVFSPYYARARRRGRADPLDHCALNVALYGERGKRWAFTERGRGSVRREPSAIEIGPSGMSWDGDTLTVGIDEVTAPLPSRIRGRVRVRPSALVDRSFTLDGKGRHGWSPVAPCSRVEVELERPALRWTGSAYVDSNWGDEPLEDAFVDWDWSRAHLEDGSASILYDVRRRSGDALSLAIQCGPDGDVRDVTAPPRVELPRTGWRVRRTTRAEGRRASVVRTLEDTPFYSRSLLSTGEPDARVAVVHESLSLDRFRQPWVQVLLPFRAPRRWR